MEYAADERQGIQSMNAREYTVDERQGLHSR